MTHRQAREASTVTHSHLLHFVLEPRGGRVDAPLFVLLRDHSADKGHMKHMKHTGAPGQGEQSGEERVPSAASPEGVTSAVIPGLLLVAGSDPDPPQVPGADVLTAGDADDGDVGVHCNRRDRHTHTQGQSGPLNTTGLRPPLLIFFG